MNRAQKLGEKLRLLGCRAARERFPYFQRHARAMRYDFQEAWYRRVLQAAGLEVTRFRFVAVEENPPHGCASYTIDPETVRQQDANVQLAMDLYRQCVESGEWPGYSDGKMIGWKGY